MRPGFRIGLFAYTSLAMLMAALGLLAWHYAHQPHQPRVVFLARGLASADPYYQRFVASLSSRHPDIAQRTIVEAVSAPDDETALSAFLAELQRTRPSLLIAQNGMQAQLARRSAPDIPLVFSSHTDPRELGVVSGLLRHAEPATGLWINDDLDTKRLEVLLDAYPTLRQVGVLGDPEWLEGLGPSRAQMLALAEARGVRLQILTASSVDEAIGKTKAPDASQNEAWCLPRTSLNLDGRLASHLAASGRLIMAGHTPDIHGAAHLSYALDKSFVAPSLADLVARVMKDERPSDIPIQVPHKYQLAIRLPTDPRLPQPTQEVVRRADLVVR